MNAKLATAHTTFHVLHIIQQLSLGGASRALIALAKYAGGSAQTHSVVSLLEADAIARRLADDAGVAVLIKPDRAALAAAINDADIVQFHFWNNPDLHTAITEDWPAMRSVVWCHVNGLEPPHVITKSIFDRADRVVASTQATMHLHAFQMAGPERTALIPGGADLTRLATHLPQSHDGLTIGYIGMLDGTKLHPGYVGMSARVGIPNARFVVCGQGPSGPAIMREAAAFGGRFEFRGYVHDIAAEIAQFDVFGYPLCKGNTTTSELVLQEVMFAGVPPVVLPYGGAADLIVHNETGLIARDEADYARCIEHLFEAPAERARLGRNAASYARRMFGAEKTAAGFTSLYSDLMKQPKRRSLPPPLIHESSKDGPRCDGARRLVLSLDGTVPELAAAFQPCDEVAAIAADRGVAQLSPAIADMVLQYRTRFADDPCLALWVGLIFLNRGRQALAAMEFVRCISRDYGGARVRHYLERAKGKTRP